MPYVWYFNMYEGFYTKLAGYETLSCGIVDKYNK